MSDESSSRPRTRVRRMLLTGVALTTSSLLAWCDRSGPGGGHTVYSNPKGPVYEQPPSADAGATTTATQPQSTDAGVKDGAAAAQVEDPNVIIYSNPKRSFYDGALHSAGDDDRLAIADKPEPSDIG